ncbi:MAG: glycosyltransferase family 2 protein, partial [Melioribacteraceae bacterium]|nr:glycosyltransferase family 2 protein [Melioribacteraceae bacterium]
MKISIVVPCYNEELVLQRFLDLVKKTLLDMKVDFEIIFVNDGSKDQTHKILQNLSNHSQEVRYISFSKNFGKEAAMLAGLTYSSGTHIVLMDADLQHPPSLIPQMLELSEQGFDQVIAKRNRIGESLPRSLISNMYYKLINRLVDVELVSGVGDFRMMSRKAVNAILSLQEYNRFSKGLFSWIGFSEHVIEYDNVIRDEGDSKWSFRKLLNYGIDGVISFNDKPLRIAIYLGLFVTFVDLLYVFYMLIQIIGYGIEVPGYFTTISAILLIGGIQLFFMGIIGEYIGRI